MRIMKAKRVLMVLVLFIFAGPADASEPRLLDEWCLSTSGIVGLAIVGDGGICLTSSVEDRVFRLSPAGEVLSAWGEPGQGPGQFSSPAGIASDGAGMLFVADLGNHRVQVFTPEGEWIRMWGTEGDSDGQFRHPLGVAVDNAGFVYVSESDRIQKFSEEGEFVTSWVGGYGPIAMAVKDSRLYVASLGASIVEVFSTSGQHLNSWVVSEPSGIAVRGDDHNEVVVLSRGTSRVSSYSLNGVLLDYWGNDDLFQFPYGLAIFGERTYLTAGGCVHVFEAAPTAVQPSTWGGLKARYD